MLSNQGAKICAAILPNTPAAQTLGPAELEKRTSSFNARRALLRSNPSLYVSKTRLSVRQLPLFVSERLLKRLAKHSIRTFNAEVKAGTRQGLTVDELREVRPADEDDEPDPRGGKGKGKVKGGRDTGVKQSKIVRQQDRVDPLTGKGRSKGYGFLELSRHADALRVLRWANNNPEVGTLFAEWWKEELEDMIAAEKKAKKEDGRLERLKAELESGVQQKKAKGVLIMEFSIENVQVVKRRTTHQQEQRVCFFLARLSIAKTEVLTFYVQSSSDTKKPQRRPSLVDVKTEAEEERPRKKSRKSGPPPSNSPTKVASEEKSKHGQNIGALIGKKRKERKGKKARS